VYFCVDLFLTGVMSTIIAMSCACQRYSKRRCDDDDDDDDDAGAKV